MSSVRSSSTPGLDLEEEAERELREAMSLDSLSRDETDNSEEIDELEGDTEAPPSTTGAAETTNHFLLSPAVIRRELAAARRKSDILKLHPYQRMAIEEFVKGTPISRQVSLMAQLFSVGNNIASFKLEAPPFVSSPQLLENIKTITIAVLLSCNLSAYKKNNVPFEHVMTVLRARKCFPEHLDSDSYARKVLKSDIQEELTQTRARIKKAIKDSIKPIERESDSIFDLATAIISNSKTAVSVPLCARIALLRKMFVQHSDGTFWDRVDARLLLIRNTAKGDSRKINRAFETFLDTDRNTYGDSTTYTLTGANDVFQNSVDELIAAPSDSSSNM